MVLPREVLRCLQTSWAFHPSPQIQTHNVVPCAAAKPTQYVDSLKNTLIEPTVLLPIACNENALQTLQQLCISLLRDIVNAQYLRISISIC
jgi:hypothetical protein